jgi:hypothetical protein
MRTLIDWLKDQTLLEIGFHPHCTPVTRIPSRSFRSSAAEMGSSLEPVGRKRTV